MLIYLYTTPIVLINSIKFNDYSCLELYIDILVNKE